MVCKGPRLLRPLAARLEAQVKLWGAGAGTFKGKGPAITEVVALVAALVGLELLLVKQFPSTSPAWSTSWLLRIASFRAVELGALALWARLRGIGPAHFGLTGARAMKGLRTGLLLSALFGLCAAGAEAIFKLLGAGSFLSAVSGPRVSTEALPALFLAAVVVAPFFEELLFRGIVYGALRRRLQVLPALIATTALFALAHSATGGVPWVQAVGGIVFVYAYEKSSSLWAPFTVHALGNFALFALPFIV